MEYIQNVIDFNNRLYFAVSNAKKDNIMEPIEGYDAWKTTPPSEVLTDQHISIIEQNLARCPFCGNRPCFEDSVDGWFVSCKCGVSMPGDDPIDASAKWATRPKFENLREGPRAYWPGA